MAGAAPRLQADTCRVTPIADATRTDADTSVARVVPVDEPHTRAVPLSGVRSDCSPTDVRPHPADATDHSRRATRRRGRPPEEGELRAFLTSGSLDIQSKLLVMLLAVSIVAALVVAVVGYVNGRESLQAAAFNQVTSLREARITELKRSFGSSPRRSSRRRATRA